MTILLAYAGIGTLIAIALGIAGCQGERAFLAGMIWPAFLHAAAQRLRRGRTSWEDLVRWVGLHTPIHQVQIRHVAIESDDPDRFVAGMRATDDTIPG